MWIRAVAAICAAPLPYVDLAEMDQAERFRWLAAPKSTLLQVSQRKWACATTPSSRSTVYLYA